MKKEKAKLKLIIFSLSVVNNNYNILDSFLFIFYEVEPLHSEAAVVIQMMTNAKKAPISAFSNPVTIITGTYLLLLHTHASH